MNSISNIRNISTLAFGALLGGQEAMAYPWCPTANARSINCQGCTVELSCDVYNLQGIIINGSNVTFDGGWHTIYNSTYHAVSVGSSGTTTIKNLYIDNSQSVVGVSAVSSNGYTLNVENVWAQDGSAGVAHNYGGKLVTTGGGFSNNIDGIYAGFGTTNGGWADSYSTPTWSNSRYGSYRNTKPVSYVYNSSSYDNSNHGALIEYSPYSRIWDSYFSDNKTSGKNGLRLVSSSNSQITTNTGFNNPSYDCITVSSSNVYASGNYWGSYSGSCN